MKNSLKEALENARKLSIQYPLCKVYVMDKPYKKSRVHLNRWCVDQSIIDGWYPVARFVNGEEVKR